MGGEKKKGLIILVITILIIVLVLVSGIIISNKKEKDALKNEEQVVNVEDSNNVSVVDEKLKQGDYRVSQSYLLSYTKNKGNVWYSSKGVVTKIKYKDNNALITISGEDDKSKKVIGFIDKEGLKIKENDVVYFVGSVDISDGNIILARISKEEIDYKNVVVMSLEDLSDNIYYLKNTYVIVSGYMITVGDKYKLYSSKSDYKKDEEYGSYFNIEWAKEFNYTGTSEVLLKCFIGDKYKLIGCEMEK